MGMRFVCKNSHIFLRTLSKPASLSTVFFCSILFNSSAALTKNTPSSWRIDLDDNSFLRRNFNVSHSSSSTFCKRSENPIAKKIDVIPFFCKYSIFSASNLEFACDICIQYITASAFFNALFVSSSSIYGSLKPGVSTITMSFSQKILLWKISNTSPVLGI